MSTESREGRFDYIEFVAASPAHLAGTRDFFSRVFGWEYRQWGDGYADTHDSGVVSGIAVDDDGSPVPLPTVYTTDLEGLRTRVLEAGGEITRDVFSFPGGRRFHFREPSGHVLAAWTEADE